MTTMTRMRTPLLALAALAVTAAVGPAEAHFELQEPAAATAQDDLGNPQKFAPCGPSDGGTPTGAVTTYQAGSTITITIDETIFHPGHYRVALAVNDPSELPAAPPVTPSSTDECASTVIQDPPVFPILADGMLAHTAAFGSPQSFEVTLPSDVTCDNCTLQVLEYMSNHGAPCFYYHCATIAIQEDPVMTTSTTASAGPSSGAGGATGAGGASGAGGSSGVTQPTLLPADTDEGCSCTLVGSRRLPGAFALAGLAALALWRRRRHGAA